ncbi:MAG: purine-nucleoside phosphorylase [Candidatus Cloacimonetes bacterium]|nr:purine-nucleoside phosphorylase [Candidatus Cloacimonadota bacterium]
MNIIEKIELARSFISRKINTTPEIAIILGTGLNGLAGIVENPVFIEYSSIPHFVTSTAPSHEGRLVFGTISGKNVILLQGRFHFYEGYTMEELTFPIRVLKSLGVNYLLLTNAAGSLNPEIKKGDIVLIKDHINFIGTNPLIGKNYDELGERFPSMNEPYDRHLIKTAQSIALENNIDVKNGVYIAVSGPSLETKSESIMLSRLGADVVGMSTVPETITAVHAGMKVFAASIATNLSNIFHSEPHTQEEIRDSAEQAGKNLTIIIKDLIKKI